MYMYNIGTFENLYSFLKQIWYLVIKKTPYFCALGLRLCLVSTQLCRGKWVYRIMGDTMHKTCKANDCEGMYLCPFNSPELKVSDSQHYYGCIYLNYSEICH